MRRIIDLLTDDDLGPAASDAVSPFVADDVLAEAELQQVRLELVSGALWSLLDLRGSLYFDRGNTAVLGAVDVESTEWAGRRHDYADSWLALPVGSSSFTREDGSWSARLGMIQGQVLTVRARSMWFVVGDVPGCDEPQPSYAEDPPATIRRRLASWESSFVPISMTSTPR